jgi:hypothetical protein
MKIKSGRTLFIVKERVTLNRNLGAACRRKMRYQALEGYWVNPYADSFGSLQFGVGLVGRTALENLMSQKQSHDCKHSDYQAHEQDYVEQAESCLSLGVDRRQGASDKSATAGVSLVNDSAHTRLPA